MRNKGFVEEVVAFFLVLLAIAGLAMAVIELKHQLSINRNYGEVVKREYIPGHMETTTGIDCYQVGDTTICVPTSDTKWVYDQYIVTFRNETGKFFVDDPVLYNTVKVGQKWQKYPTEEPNGKAD